MRPRIDQHRGYAIIYVPLATGGEVVYAVLASTPDGIIQFDSMEEYEASEYA